MMTRKDYVAFAEMYNQQLHAVRAYPEQVKLVKELVNETAKVFARDNARFDGERFAAACYKGVSNV